VLDAWENHMPVPFTTCIPTQEMEGRTSVVATDFDGIHDSIDSIQNNPDRHLIE
jgi:hypothetical protein